VIARLKRNATELGAGHRLWVTDAGRTAIREAKRLTPVFVDMAGSPDELERAIASQALARAYDYGGPYSDESIDGVLEALVFDSNEHRIQLGLRLLNTRGVSARGALATRIESVFCATSSPSTKAAALEALGRGQRGPRLLEILDQAWHDERARVRLKAIFVAIDIEHSQLQDMLTEGCSDVDPSVRCLAAQKLLSKGMDEKHAKQTLLRLSSDSDVPDHIRRSARAVLDTYGEERGDGPEKRTQGSAPLGQQ
jgi:hypothetical protein